MSARLSEPDYQLVWPRSLFVAEASRLLNIRTESDWDDRCVLLLSDAFVSDHVDGPVAAFGRIPVESADPWNIQPATMTPRQKFLKDLMAQADCLHEDPPPKRPYWRDRQSSSPRAGDARWPIDVVVREFVALVYELDMARYLDRRFDVDCEDQPRGNQAEVVIERELGTTDVWPLVPAILSSDPDLFYTVVEFLHDCVARPRKPIFYHTWNDCGWHREEFDIETGRTVYRWRVNKIFERSDSGLRMAEDGEDVGRLVTVTDGARTELVDAVVNRADKEPTTDQVRHALALFRGRGADRNLKRSAVATLALVLEERRHGVLADAMTKTDRGALFEIANGFHVRHQRADQKRDYDEFYLDWIFWVYLASIELTNRVIDEQRNLRPAADIEW
ncbi:hypothetical protein H351_32360 (plasmid) [Rhodococcus erythropolis R138]|uniref:hypothetical protein n=1 Tax=Rhodococcus erythropolis TaxID=1833 RepID=UPI0004A876BC|nr:hypothetical protein [Rhodococcus erythropolis]ALU73645.1 hypothetical protein H351_32360 [Rhodococcus erythropolis R138]